MRGWERLRGQREPASGAADRFHRLPPCLKTCQSPGQVCYGHARSAVHLLEFEILVACFPSLSFGVSWGCSVPPRREVQVDVSGCVPIGRKALWHWVLLHAQGEML